VGVCRDSIPGLPPHSVGTMPLPSAVSGLLAKRSLSATYIMMSGHFLPVGHVESSGACVDSRVSASHIIYAEWAFLASRTCGCQVLT
jgi:hypothetical protein